MRRGALLVLAWATVATAALAAPAASAAPAEDHGGFLLDVRVAAGLPLGYPASKPSALSALAIGLGWRFGPRYSAALVVDGASGDLAGLEYALGASEYSESAGCAGGAATCGWRLVLGLEGTRTFERHPWHPWAGLLVGLEGLDVGEGSQLESWFGYVLRASAGAPFWRGSGFEFSLFASAELGWWSDHELEAGGATTVLSVSEPVHGAVHLGLRVAWKP